MAHPPECKPNRAAGLADEASGHAEKWTLKRVQGDGTVSVGQFRYRALKNSPANPRAQRQYLQHRDPEQPAIERLLARLVPKQRSPGIGPERATQKGQPQQA